MLAEPGGRCHRWTWKHRNEEAPNWREIQAETKKLASEASKLDAETRRLAVSNALDVFKVVVTVAGATFAGLKVLEALDWL